MACRGGGGRKGCWPRTYSLGGASSQVEKYNRTKNYPIICTKLKLKKTCLSSFMSQERLTNLGLIVIEKEFPSADVKKEVVQIFLRQRSHLGRRN